MRQVRTGSSIKLDPTEAVLLALLALKALLFNGRTALRQMLRTRR
jgi:hypothetical protein